MSLPISSILNPVDELGGVQGNLSEGQEVASSEASTDIDTSENAKDSKESGYGFDDEGNRVSLRLPREEDCNSHLSQNEDETEDERDYASWRAGVRHAQGSQYDRVRDAYSSLSPGIDDEGYANDEGYDRAQECWAESEENNHAEASTGIEPNYDQAITTQTDYNSEDDADSKASDGIGEIQDTALSSPDKRQQSPQTTDSSPRELAKRPRNSPTPEPGQEAGPNPRKSAKTTGSTITPGTAQNTAKPHRSQRTPSPAHKLAKLDHQPSPLVLSPSKSSIYNRRQSTSPIRLPILQTPLQRDPLVYRSSSTAPPSHETSLWRFSIFNALLEHPELTLEMSKHLEVDDLITLYAISKDYHFLVNGRFTALIMAQSHGKALESSRTFIHRCYKNLCMRDPGGRTLLFNEDPTKYRQAKLRDNEVRYIPSFRWLKMILFREAVVDSILRSLAQEGHRLPRRSSLVLKKLWFTIDISDNARRVGLLHNDRFWGNKDIFVATMFFIKLDMRLTDPTTGDGETRLKRLLLGQKSLSTLARVLLREEMTSQLEVLRMIVRFDYTPRRPIPEGERVLGVPKHEVGKLCLEGWGKGDKKFCPIDELVMREGVRRRLNLQNHYVDMMVYGFVNKRTWEDIRTPVVPPEPIYDYSEEEEGFDSSDEEDVEEDEEELREREERAERMGLFGGETEDEDEEELEEGAAEEVEGESFASNGVKETGDADIVNVAIR